MDIKIKNELMVLATVLYENSKEYIGEAFEMDIEELDYATLEYESNFIVKLANMVDQLNEAETNNELDSVDDKLDLRFIKDEYESSKELKSFLHNLLYEPYDEESEQIIDSIVELIFKE